MQPQNRFLVLSYNDGCSKSNRKTDPSIQNPGAAKPAVEVRVGSKESQIVRSETG